VEIAQGEWFCQSTKITAFRARHAMWPTSGRAATLPAMVKTYCGRYLLAEGHSAPPYSLLVPGHAYCARCAAVLVRRGLT
jgi:hypothetical protein